MFNLYAYGIDVAETLNFTAIVVTHVTDAVRLRTIRKLNETSYPIIQRMLEHELFPRYPPFAVGIDYTSEKSVAEGIEAILHPGFINPYDPTYRRWERVDAIVNTDVNKLAMKQNARRFLESGIFVMPDVVHLQGPMQALVQELKDQMDREAASPGRGHVPLHFKKPKGKDNDLIIALEHNLYALRNLLDQLIAMKNGGGMMASSDVMIESAFADSDYWAQLKRDYQHGPGEAAEKLVAKLRKSLGASGSTVTGVRVNGGPYSIEDEINDNI